LTRCTAVSSGTDNRLKLAASLWVTDSSVLLAAIAKIAGSIWFAAGFLFYVVQKRRPGSVETAFEIANP